MDWPQWLGMLACDRLFDQHPLRQVLFENTEQLAADVAISILPARLDELGLSIPELHQIIYRVLTTQTTASATLSSKRRSTSGTGGENCSLESLLLDHAFMREHFTPQITAYVRHLPPVDLSLLATGAQLEKQHYRAQNSRIMTLEKQHYYTVVMKRAGTANLDNIVELFVSAAAGESNPLDSRLKLALGEILFTLSKHHFSNGERPANTNSRLFLSDSLCMQLGDIMCILIDTGMISCEDAVTALLHVPHGLWHICRLAVNFPILFEQIVAQIITVLEIAATFTPKSSSTPPLWSLILFNVLRLNPSHLLDLLESSLSKRASLRDVFLLAEARCCDLITLPPPASNRNSKFFESAGNFVLSLLKTLLAGVTTTNNDVNNSSALSGKNPKRSAGGQNLPSSSSQHISKWVYSHWREQYRQFDSSFQQLRSMLTCYLAACVHHLENVEHSDSDNDDAVLRISPDLLTVYATASCVYTLKWTEDEARLILRLVTHRPASLKLHATAAAAAQTHVIFSLAMVLLGASDKVFNDDEGMLMLKNWFQWLLNLSDSSKTISFRNEEENLLFNFADILLLFGTNLHSNQMETLSDLIQKIFGFRLSTQIVTLSAHALRMARTFADEIFTDFVLAQHVARVAPTRQLSCATSTTMMSGIVPAHCILQLIQAGVFSRVEKVGGFSVKNWILQQIRHCTAPVHTVMIDLIEAYNQQCIFPARNGQQTSVKTKKFNGGQFAKFTESEICQIFLANSKSDAEFLLAEEKEDTDYVALMLLQSSSNADEEKKSSFLNFDANDDSAVVPRILLLYAVLNFNDRAQQWLWSTIKAGGRLTTFPPFQNPGTKGANIASPFSILLLQNLPIKLLLHRMEARRTDLYYCVYAKLMRYVLQQLPHLLQVEDFIDSQQYFTNTKKNFDESIENLNSRVQKFVKSTQKSMENAGEKLDCAEISDILHKLSALSPPQLGLMQSSFFHLLWLLINYDADAKYSTKIKESVKIILVKLNAICPARLWCDLISLYNRNTSIFGSRRRSTIDFEKLCDEPLLIFQTFLNDSVLKQRNSNAIVLVLVEFVLRIFKCCLAAQQVQLTNFILQNCYEKFQYAQETAAVQQQKQKVILPAAQNGEWPPTTGAQMLDITQKYTNKKLDAYLKLQSSAAIQCLLEFCRKIMSSSSSCQSAKLLGVICNHLHQEFIHDAYVSKLVAFQGFSLDLLPLLVARVPSFHICLDFIPELLGQWQLNKKVFAYHLLAHLACKYRVQKALNVSHMALDVANTILVVCESEERLRVFTSIAPCLVVLARLFVPLRANALALLQQLARMEQSMLAKQQHRSVMMDIGMILRQKNDDEDENNNLLGSEQRMFSISNEELLASNSAGTTLDRRKKVAGSKGTLQPLAEMVSNLGAHDEKQNACT